MFSRLLKGLATAAAFWFMNRYRRLSINLVKIEAATYYIKAIQSGRQGFRSALLVWLAVFFFALGVVLLHAGLFAWLYLWFQSLKAVAIGLLVLGGIYTIVILLIARSALSEEAWMKFFKADKLVEELTKKS
jgi:urease accessory protein UreF